MASVLLILGAIASGGPQDPASVELTARERRIIGTMSPLPHPPPDPTNRVADDPAAARLGQFLFFDTRLSSDGGVSCATCHDPKAAFSDGKPLAEGVGIAIRNSPTLLNTAHQRWLFWDGRADSLWAQALQPLENDVEMRFDRLALVHLLGDDHELRVAYEQLFGLLPPLQDRDRFPRHAKPMEDDPADPRHRAWLTMSEPDRKAINTVFSNIGKVIAAYVRRLVSRNSVFDAFASALHADAPAPESFPIDARRGLRLFIGRAGCRNCHHGPMLSDREFHNIGVAPNPDVPSRDSGRYDGLRKLREDPFNGAGEFVDAADARAARRIGALIDGPELWGQIRTPSLRNVAATAPYMHQGQFATLREVLNFYVTREGALPPGHHQEQILAPLDLSPRDIDDLIAFLESLTDVGLDPALLQTPGSPRLDP